jgi:hypothetical protein
MESVMFSSRVSSTSVVVSSAIQLVSVIPFAVFAAFERGAARLLVFVPSQLFYFIVSYIPSVPFP